MKPSHGLGWRRDIADFRDYTVDHPKVAGLLARTISLIAPGTAAPPPAVDLRGKFSPVFDQGPLGSCTANAACGLVEYYERQVFGRFVPASRLFVYKATRNLTQETGDTGAELRQAMQALVMFGAPPEQYWPYDVGQFDAEPPAFCYALAQDYKAVKYLRLDPAGQTPAQTLQQIKSFCAAGHPSMFGFTVYKDAIAVVQADGKIPFPSRDDTVDGGHAIVCAGYDDRIQISGTIGALLIRNSWGSGWGIGGYGWLPYDYVLRGLATDFWALTSENWVDLKVFQ